MKQETKQQTLERLAFGWPINKEGLKNLLEMAYDAGRNYMPLYLVDENGKISVIPEVKENA